MGRRRPILTIFAGPNGSGKSSLTRHLAAASYDFADYINPDDIAATLSGSCDARVREAQSIADARRADAVTKHRSFTFETVFSHPSKLDVLNLAQSAGFEVVLFFIAVDDPMINVERVGTRVELGGHNVPADRIIARYQRTMALLPQMLEFVDRAWIFDNTVRASPATTTFSGRLIATASRTREVVVVVPRYPLPDWAERYLIEPLRANTADAVVQYP
jgi:predicted ABC-type ATPase